MHSEAECCLIEVKLVMAKMLKHDRSFERI